ncbi:hypothetical protein [Ralstonia phage RP13]|nr:hypothetical protein [Ralstonia phage RP13]
MFQAIITYLEGNKIPSINDMYLIGRSGNKAWKYLNPKVADFKLHIKTSILKQGVAEYFQNKKDFAIELEILIVFSDNFWVRDCSNTIKAIEDALAEVIKVDDRFNVKVNVRKILNDKDKNEYIILVAKDIPKDSPIIRWSTCNVQT